MGDSINVGFSIVGDDRKKTVNVKAIDRHYIIGRIKGANLPVEIQEELVRRLTNYSDGALNSFWKNLPDMIETLKLQRAKDEL